MPASQVSREETRKRESGLTQCNPVRNGRVGYDRKAKPTSRLGPLVICMLAPSCHHDRYVLQCPNEATKLIQGALLGGEYLGGSSCLNGTGTGIVDECAQALDAVSSETSCTVERQMGVLYVDCVAGSAA